MHEIDVGGTATGIRMVAVTSLELRGARAARVATHDDPDAGSGAVVNQVKRALKQSTGNEARNQVGELMKGLSMLYLTDLDEQALKSGPWPFARYGDAGNSRTFTVNGLEYPNGLGLHPSDRNFASVSFAIAGRYDTFTTGAAIADHDVHVAGDIVLWVLGDGKVLWKSKPFKSHGDIQYCQVSVDDVNVLELRTQAVNSAYGGHAVWLDPHASR